MAMSGAVTLLPYCEQREARVYPEAKANGVCQRRMFRQMNCNISPAGSKFSFPTGFPLTHPSLDENRTVRRSFFTIDIEFR